MKCNFPYCLEGGGDQCLQLEGCDAIPNFETHDPKDIDDKVTVERTSPSRILGDVDDEIDWYALSNGLDVVFPDGTRSGPTEDF